MVNLTTFCLNLGWWQHIDYPRIISRFLGLSYLPPPPVFIRAQICGSQAPFPSSTSVVGGDFLISRHFQIGPRAHSSSTSLGTGVVFLGQSSCCMTCTTYLHLLLKLRQSGAIPLLPLCAFMACTGQYDLFLLMEAAYLSICLQR